MAEFRDFQDILTDLDAGSVHNQLTHRLREVVLAVQAATEAGQPLCGELTLKLTVKPEGTRQLIIVPKITAKLPQLKQGITMFFADKKGDLVKEDPKQLPLREAVGRATGAELKEARTNV